MSNTTLKEMMKKQEEADSQTAMEAFLTERNLIVTKMPSSELDATRLLTTTDVCNLLRIERHQVYYLANSKELRGFKEKQWKFKLADVQNYIAERSKR